MANLKRYERHTWFDGDGDDFHNMRPASDGEWVKFEDVEEFLKASANTASAPCSNCLYSIRGQFRRGFPCSACNSAYSSKFEAQRT